MVDIDFGLDKIGNVFDQQTDLQMNRQLQEKAALDRVNQANEKKAKIATASADITLGLLGDFQGLAAVAETNKAAAEKQAQRFSSGNPMDFLEGIGDQILDPAKYTARGRAKTMSEASQYVNVKSNLAGAQQQALMALSQNVDAALTVSNAPLEAARLAEQQGMEQINTEKLRLGTMSENMARQQAMQNMALAALDSTQVKALVAKSNGEPVDVGGVLIQPGMLQARADDLERREDLIQDRENARTLKQEAVVAKRNRKVLETYSLEELRPMLQSGDPTGTFDLKDIQDVYGIKSSAQSDQIARATTQLQYGDYSAQVIIPAAESADRAAPNVPKGTPLEAATNGLKTTAAMVASLTAPFVNAGKPVPVEVMMAGNQAIQQAQDQFNKAIDQQAKLNGKGDKDLVELYTEKYRGNPLPAATVESAVQARLSKNQPLTDIFPVDVANNVQSLYASKVQKLTAESKIGLGNGMDKATIQAQAQREAVQEAVGQQIESRTNSLIANQVTYPGHPLAGVLDSTGLLQLTNAADTEARDIFMKRNNLTPEEMNIFMQGQQVPGKNPNRAELTQTENTQLMFKLDTLRPGMAKKYAEWWGNHGKFYLNLTEQNRIKAAAGDSLQNQAFESFAAPVERRGGEMYMGGVQLSGQYYGEAMDERYNNLVSFDMDPVKRQATLVQFDDSLSDSDRRTFIEKVVLPLADAAQQSGADYEQTNQMIEQAVTQGQSEDPEITKIFGKIAKNRDKVIKNVDSIAKKPWWGPFSLTDLTAGSIFGGLITEGAMAKSTNRDYSWLTDLMRNRTPPASTQQNLMNSGFSSSGTTSSGGGGGW